MKRTAIIGTGVAVLAYLGRFRLVHLLTATTGTWIGSPPPTSGARAATEPETG